ncbi:MAG: hypothetical protein MHM6MM_007512 [Cercozoa sp. M6MM]
MEILDARTALTFGFGGLAAGFALARLYEVQRQRQQDKQRQQEEEEEDSDAESEYDSDDEEGWEYGGAGVGTGYSERFLKGDDEPRMKFYLCVRTDLKMQKGKIAAQCSHATWGLGRALLKKDPALLDAWHVYGQPKITLKLTSKEQMLELAERAKQEDLPCYIVVDAGRTQVEPGSFTVLAIGPLPEDVGRDVVGHLKLL